MRTCPIHQDPATPIEIARAGKLAHAGPLASSFRSGVQAAGDSVDEMESVKAILPNK